MKAKPDNLVVITGRVSDGPYLMPGAFGGSIDFELKTKNGVHQVVSVEKEIVDGRRDLSGVIRVFGSLSSKDGDSVILAKRIELRS